MRSQPVLEGVEVASEDADGLREAMFQIPTAHGTVARSPNAQWTKDGRLTKKGSVAMIRKTWQNAPAAAWRGMWQLPIR